jgi:protein associated with RNAse G/E
MKDSGGICYYVNVASPTISDHGFLKYIDYDLDVKLFPDETIKELDEQEFERHVLTYGYSSELTSAIKKSFSAIKTRMQNGEFPFTEKDVRTLYQKFLDENHPFVLHTFETK